MQQFNIQAADLGIKILSAHQFQPISPGSKRDLSTLITAAKAAGARVFALCMDGYSAAL